MIVNIDREEGEERIYVTRFASVISYFTAAEKGVSLNVIPGHTCYASEFERARDEVRACVLAEIAARLGTEPGQVCQCSMGELRKIADPELPKRYRYARRRDNRPYPFR